MPALLTDSRILVTGANGYLATWICLTLLSHGYSVKGAVRSASKGDYLKKLFAKHGDAFSYVIVDDMSKDGAYDEHVRDVQGVLHTAAKATSNATSPDELIGPNVNGVLSLMKSVLKFGTTVRRFVYTSTTGVLLDRPGQILTEETIEWNDALVERVESGADVPGIFYYLASKVLAEKAALKFVDEHEKEMSWDFVSLIVPWIIGPQIQEINSRKDLTEAIAILYRGLEVEWPAEERYTHFANWADVRDIALAHVLALEKEAAGGERFLISAGQFALQDIYDAIHSVPSSLTDVPRGDPGVPRGPMCTLSSEKAERMLGITYRPLAESVTEALVDMRDKLSRLPA